MRILQRSLFTSAVLLITFASFAAEPTYENIRARLARAEAAIESGEVDPEKDLAPVIALLRNTKDGENRERVVDRISDLGSADGSSPAAVKRYLLAESTSLLIEIAENTKNKWSLRDSAIHALRDMGAPRDVLQRVADMALKDADSFVQSRGEILQNFIASMPAEPETASIQPVDAAKEHDAIAFLKSRNLGVSLDQLRLSSIGAESDEVTALLAAGVDPNSGNAADSPLNRALSACAHDGGESDAIVATVKALLAGGADLKKKDDNQNTPLMSAAQYCGARVVQLLLDSGAEVSPRNGSGITPLTMALIMSHFDAAETLVAKGARLTAADLQMVSASASDPRAQAIIAKASPKKK
jgi:hypothetical protein